MLKNLFMSFIPFISTFLAVKLSDMNHEVVQMCLFLFSSLKAICANEKKL